jgi:hypothetical protein
VKHALCDESGQCAYRKGDRMLYLDSHHLTWEGASYTLRDFQLPPFAAADEGPAPGVPANQSTQ